jgi:hypothetical protein
MSDGPVARVRRRFARSIDWRVDTAVKQAMAAQQAEALAVHQLIDRIEFLELRNEQLFAIVERLRTSITALSVSLTDDQHAQGQLLERLAEDVGNLTERTPRRPESTTKNTAI